jgi:hypothetical protein
VLTGPKNSGATDITANGTVVGTTDDYGIADNGTVAGFGRDHGAPSVAVRWQGC